MDFSHKKIGIWGFGIVGQSALRFFYQKNAQCCVLEKKELTPDQKNLLQTTDSLYIAQKDSSVVETFFQQHDFILTSPGIDLRPYNRYADKFLTELDIFGTFFKKPIIAITGTVGKTTVTHVLSHMLISLGMRVTTGGNIGIGMLDLLIEQQDTFDIAVLEVSSFQLEYCTRFKPHLAIWTNFYPNHLDRHETVSGYFAAKTKLVMNQDLNDHALLPLDVFLKLPQKIYSAIGLLLSQAPTAEESTKYAEHDLFFVQDSTIMHAHKKKISSLISLHKLPAYSFINNWVTMIGALHTLGFSVEQIADKLSEIKLPEHRLEIVTVHNGVTFYNDSKSTIAQATVAAVNRVRQNGPVILLLGGVSKGVNRTMLAHELRGKVKSVICFGKEAEELAHSCRQEQLQSFVCAKLEDAVEQSTIISSPGDQVLFSPGGASFDLFANYQERGNRFKELILQVRSDNKF